jgi:hypothetical protein
VTNSERSFVRGAIGKRRLFLGLSVVGVIVGLGLAAFYLWQRFHQPDYPFGVRMVVVLLVLLNARQNLRQYRYATVLRELAPGGAAGS